MDPIVMEVSVFQIKKQFKNMEKDRFGDRLQCRNKEYRKDNSE